MGHIEDELARIRARQRAAAAGLSGAEAFEAGIRAGMEHALANMDPSLRDFEAALGVELDPGVFLMGMQCAAFAVAEVDAIAVAKDPAYRELLLEYMERARALR